MGETIVQATRETLPAVVETLAQAFQTDPALSWILPDPDHRARTPQPVSHTCAGRCARGGRAAIGGRRSCRAMAGAGASR